MVVSSKLEMLLEWMKMDTMSSWDVSMFNFSMLLCVSMVAEILYSHEDNELPFANCSIEVSLAIFLS